MQNAKVKMQNCRKPGPSHALVLALVPVVVLAFAFCILHFAFTSSHTPPSGSSGSATERTRQRAPRARPARAASGSEAVRPVRRISQRVAVSPKRKSVSLSSSVALAARV